MAQWSKSKVLPEDINSGNEFTTNDNLALNELNAIVNNSFYSTEKAEQAEATSAQALSEVEQIIITQAGTIVKVDGQPVATFNADGLVRETDIDNNQNINFAKAEREKVATDGEIVHENDLANVMSLPIGAITLSALPISDSRFHILDGTTIASTGIYSEFATYLNEIMQSHPEIACTQAEFDTDVLNTGNCGKFVIDTVNQTIRLPKITRFVQGLSSISDIGTSVSAGLPNITGQTILGSKSYEAPMGEAGTVSGAFKKGSGYSTTHIMENVSGTWTGYPLQFDASNSNSIYGNSSTVQPQATKYPYYIVLATGVNYDDIQVDINQVLADLNAINNTKAEKSLSNVSYPEIIANGIAQTGAGDRVIESYVSSDGLTWYRKWASGWKECGTTIVKTTTHDVTFTFPNISFNNINYTVSSFIVDIGDSFYANTIKSRTSSNVVIYVQDGRTGFNTQIYCCGY